MVAPSVGWRKTGRIDSMGGRFWPRRGHLHHCKTEADFLSGPGFAFIPGTAFLVHREVFQETGGLDEALVIYWDDVDWSMRVQAKGYPLRLDLQWQVRHHVGKTCHGKSLYSLYYFQRNRRRISRRYCKNGLETLVFEVLFSIDLIRLFVKLVRRARWRDLGYLHRIWLEA